MKKLLLLIAFLLTVAWTYTIYGTAPFCKCNDFGTCFCYYYSMSSCRAVLSYGEFCAMR